MADEKVFDWPLRKWFDKHGGEDVWMVCRAGHLWCTELPSYIDFGDRRSVYFTRRSRERMQRVTKCPQCQLLKQINRHHRGITRVCPDYQGLITEARVLDGGTIEHHHPEQVAAVYSDKAAQEWRSMLAFVGLQLSWVERNERKRGK